MRSKTLVAASVGIALTVLGASAAGAQCRGADSMATRIVRKYAGLMERAATDPAVVQKLAAMGLTPVAPASVVLVTEKSICSKAERAYSADLRGNGASPSGSVYVVKVGNAYVVRDPAQTAGEGGYFAEMVLDSGYRIKYRLSA